MMEHKEANQHATPPQQTCCCIAGCGPAGAMLGYLLARQGIDVVVLEKHSDFLRDFRGDTIHPSTIAVMQELGLADELLRLPHTTAPVLKVRSGQQIVTVADFRHLKTPWPYLVFLPQWDFLNFLTDKARQYPTFQLFMNAEAQETIEENGVIHGLRYTMHDSLHEIRATLTIAADGRTSCLRQDADMKPDEQSPPMDVLWFRLSRTENDPGDTFANVNAGHILLLINRGEYWQAAYVIPKGMYQQVHGAGLDQFKRSLADLLPAFPERAQEITSWDQVKLLTVSSNRLRRWYRPGLLCIGDAAHAMSPIGGVGINLALQDAVVAANVLAEPLKTNRLQQRHLQEVQRKRILPTIIIQQLQTILQKRLTAPVLRGERVSTVAAPLQLFFRLLHIPDLAAHLIAFGVWPVHVKK